jgi:hypothetical protein
MLEQVDQVHQIQFQVQQLLMLEEEEEVDKVEHHLDQEDLEVEVMVVQVVVELQEHLTQVVVEEQVEVQMDQEEQAALESWLFNNHPL